MGVWKRNAGLFSNGRTLWYIADKCKLFSQTSKNGFCILNKDDKHFEQAKEASNGKVLTYGEGTDNDLYFKNIRLYPGRNLFTIVYKDKEYEIDSPMAGLFNIYNLSAAILTLFALGYDFDYIEKMSEGYKKKNRQKLQ